MTSLGDPRTPSNLPSKLPRRSGEQVPAFSETALLAPGSTYSSDQWGSVSTAVIWMSSGATHHHEWLPRRCAI